MQALFEVSRQAAWRVVVNIAQHQIKAWQH
jgi:hypothetical protein